MKQLTDLRAIAFHLQSINNAHKSVSTKLNTADTFERGMKVGYEITSESIAPYIEELNKIVAELVESQQYMIDDIGGDELESA